MRVSAQQQFETGMGGLTVDLWRMRQQNREFRTGNLRHCLLNIVHPVVMSIINPYQMNALSAAHERLGLVEEHPYPHVLHCRDHADRDRKSTRLNSSH